MTFSLSPAKTTNDHATSDGMKLFAKAITPQKTAYDGAPDRLHLFLGNFWDHANTLLIGPGTLQWLQQVVQTKISQCAMAK
jgi:hypothetical protein